MDSSRLRPHVQQFDTLDKIAIILHSLQTIIHFPRQQNALFYNLYSLSSYKERTVSLKYCYIKLL